MSQTPPHSAKTKGRNSRPRTTNRTPKTKEKQVIYLTEVGLSEPTLPDEEEASDGAPSISELKHSLRLATRTIQHLTESEDLARKKLVELDARISCMQCGLSYRDTIVYPCGHPSICNSCIANTVVCPLCKAEITETKKRTHSPAEVEILLALLNKKHLQDQALLAAMKPPTEEEMRRFKLEEVFSHFDKDDSGYIEKEELRSFMRVFIYRGLEIGEQELAAGLEIVDSNGDGFVSPEEFINFMSSLTNNMNSKDFDNAVTAVAITAYRIRTSANGVENWTGFRVSATRARRTRSIPPEDMGNSHTKRRSNSVSTSASSTSSNAFIYHPPRRHRRSTWGHKDEIQGDENIIKHLEGVASAEQICLLINLQNRELTPEDYDTLLVLDSTVQRRGTLSTREMKKMARKNSTILKKSDGRECSICLCDMEEGEEVLRLPSCTHEFHRQCISTWLTDSAGRCPCDNLPPCTFEFSKLKIGSLTLSFVVRNSNKIKIVDTQEELQLSPGVYHITSSYVPHMYFCIGWPCTLSSGTNTLDIELVLFDHAGLFLAAASRNQLFIWSAGQNRVLLGFYEKGPAAIESDGSFRHLLWNADSSILAAITTKGMIQFYTVTRTTDDLSEFHFDTEHHFIHLASTRTVRIELKSSHSLAAVCMTAVHDEIILGSRDGNIHRISWDGIILESLDLRTVPFSHITVTSQSTSNGDNLPPGRVVRSSSGSLLKMVSPVDHPSAAASFLQYNSILNVMGIVLENGTAGVLQLTGKPLSHLRGYAFGVTRAVCLSINSKHHLAAVGCSDGEIHLFHLVGIKYTRTFSLQPWGITEDHTGGVSSVQWTPDNCCLAVGWKRRGLSVWSLYGCRLMCTIPQLEGARTSSRNDMMHSFTNFSINSATHKEPLRDGVKSLSWGPGGYHLVTAGVKQNTLLQFHFVKSLSTSTTLNGCERIMLVGEDRLLLLSYKGKELDDIKWRHLQIPNMYLLDNWPIRKVEMNREGTQIAVAGQRGVTLYNDLNKRWKIFGDRDQERSIECACLSWYKDIVIIASLATGNKVKPEENPQYELLFYPRSHLDASTLLLRFSLPLNRTPLFMDCNDTYLIVFTSHSFFYEYAIHPQTDNSGKIKSIKLSLMSQVSMASSIITSPLSFTLLPSIDSKSISSARGLVLQSSGTLMLADMGDNTQITLSPSVEQFWMSDSAQPNDSSSELGNTLWAYGALGLQVWFPFVSTQLETMNVQSTKIMNRDTSLEFDLEVYPIGFLSELGIIVGLTQYVDYSFGTEHPNFDLKIKIHPFLHSILRHLISKQDEEKAFEIAINFSTIPHFSHSLELLLHETLDDEKVDNVNLKTTEDLKRVVTFLSRFPHYPEVVARCARKTDPAIWRQLFSIVGSPKILFDNLVMAASYLRILQYIEGHRESRLCALKLLEESLSVDDLELASDLMRFLQPSEDMWGEPKVEENNGDKSSGELGITPDDQEYYLQELLLARYARKLLYQQKLKQLLHFSRRIGHDLRTWLAREKRRAAVTENQETALAMVHIQFNIPYPKHAEPPTSVRLLSPVMTGGGDELPPENPLDSLRFLLGEMTAAGCQEWCLILATVLMDIPIIMTLLRDGVHLWKPYQKMLQSQTCEGYRELLEFVTSNLQLPEQQLTSPIL
ncbi:hypothetical protein PROFUN_00997 [Planoprotostelium fungivorum]|uniref:Uncharacterized protein n=1 Tax=Planoprotostelium fungivorum TaxID=1890364 RepID=A0A2P6N4E3_9EUKA|nr:hypothetical protein PROFUN_00997 [Planoprotostelium fungivorum]